MGPVAGQDINYMLVEEVTMQEADLHSRDPDPRIVSGGAGTVVYFIE